VHAAVTGCLTIGVGAAAAACCGEAEGGATGEVVGGHGCEACDELLLVMIWYGGFVWRLDVEIRFGGLRC
jgi:hypothetical protein